MKKFLMFMLMMIGMVTSVTLITSCDNHRVKSSYFNKKDSVEIAKIAKNVMESSETITFKDPHEFMVHVAVNRDKYNLEQIVFGIPDQTLSGILSVLSRRKIPLCIENVADEYIKNKPFYDGVSDGINDYRAETPTDTVVHQLTIGGQSDELYRNLLRRRSYRLCRFRVDHRMSC